MSRTDNTLPYRLRRTEAERRRWESAAMGRAKRYRAAAWWRGVRATERAELRSAEAELVPAAHRHAATWECW